MYYHIAEKNLWEMLTSFLTRGGRVHNRPESGIIEVTVTPEEHSIDAVDRAIQLEAARTLGENADFCGGMEASFTMNPPMSDEMRREVLAKAGEILTRLRDRLELPD
ncbi:hypothetical protein IU459_09685 [Nocardia amamiensis]|uniref:Uncharacterized protein n=1 Tax=Nocardia amamiensis TaxID=404578 RepID=A0ABS0CNP1_9NOCA|nr:hypothetical protein [Nocardia amamiensis]MBF6297815.1 hypothetical protein [Nocardia amamiensis]